MRDNIYQTDYISCPFVMGIFKPRIYLPSSILEKEMGYMLLHEQVHIRRKDHLWKLLAFCGALYTLVSSACLAGVSDGGQGYGNVL